MHFRTHARTHARLTGHHGDRGCAAGKSTLLRLLAGRHMPKSGRIQVGSPHPLPHQDLGTPHRDGVTIDLSRLHRSHHAVALRLRQVADIDPFRDRSAPTKVSLIVPGWASESAPNPSPCRVAVASLGGGGR
jgi:hypothetical protein